MRRGWGQDFPSTSGADLSQCSSSATSTLSLVWEVDRLYLLIKNVLQPVAYAVHCLCVGAQFCCLLLASISVAAASCCSDACVILSVSANRTGTRHDQVPCC
jgi:hypothetical protein